jgi:glycosyltransferase involved in cell wall biosynthesis
LDKKNWPSWLQTVVFSASVIICTYNGAVRIGGVLAALARQTLVASDWEVLVIDNASTDDTGEVAARLIQTLLAGRGRVVHEERQGLSHARARAAQEACGDIICFLDDDNIPAQDFVAAAVQAFVDFPKAGVIGGRVLPRWETKPTPLAEAVAPFALAICDCGSAPKRFEAAGGGIVGAGLCVRRSVLCEVFAASGLASAVTDRRGASLISGGDLAISILARQSGWECWYVPTLQIEHVLPAGRMEKAYLLRLYKGIGRGQGATRKLYDWKARTLLAWLIAAKDCARWLLGWWRGPSARLPQEGADIHTDLHDLHQNMVLGRALQAVFWWR